MIADCAPSWTAERCLLSSDVQSRRQDSCGKLQNDVDCRGLAGQDASWRVRQLVFISLQTATASGTCCALCDIHKRQHIDTVIRELRALALSWNNIYICSPFPSTVSNLQCK